MLQSAGATHGIPVSNLLRATSMPGRISLPLAGNGYLYASFEHVMGVPSGHEGKGFSVNKLKLLDILIDRLVELRGRRSTRSSDPDDSLRVPERSNEALDALIEQYEQEFHEELLKDGLFRPPVEASGLIFDHIV